MKPDVLQQIKEIDEQRKKDQQQQQQQPQTIMLQEPGKEPVAIGLAEAVNIVNQQNEQIRKLIAHSQELERMNQQLQNKIVSLEQAKMHENSTKTVSFSEPLEKPSVTVQELLKQKDQKIAELESELQSLKNTPPPPQVEAAVPAEIRIVKIQEEPTVKSPSPAIVPIKERSKLEPEFMIKI